MFRPVDAVVVQESTSIIQIEGQVARLQGNVRKNTMKGRVQYEVVRHLLNNQHFVFLLKTNGCNVVQNTIYNSSQNFRRKGELPCVFQPLDQLVPEC